MTISPNDDIKVPPVVAPPLALPDSTVAAPKTAQATLSYQTPEELQVPPGWTSPEIFTLAPERFASYMMLVILFRLAAFVVMLLSILVMFWLLFKPDNIRAWLANMLVLIGVMSVVQTVKIWRLWIKAKQHWEGYKLIVADQGLLQKTPAESPITMRIADIRRVTEDWQGFRVWIGHRCVILPKRVVNIERLRVLLDAKWSIAAGSGKGRTIATYVFSLVMIVVVLAAMVGSAQLTHPGAVIGCLAVVVLWSAWGTWRVMRIVNLPLYTKIASWVMAGVIVLYAMVRLTVVLIMLRRR